MKLSMVSLISILLWGSASSAQASDASEIGKWWKNSAIVNELRLSESQVHKIEQRFLDYRPTLADLISELKNRESELSGLMTADPIDETRVRNSTKIVAVLRSELEKANSLMMIAFRKELTAKQWDRLQKIRREGRASAPSEVAGAPMTAITLSGEQVYIVGGSVKAPRLRSQPLSLYTREARSAGIQGTILLQVVIRKDGRVTDLTVLRGLGYGLDESAIETVGKYWKFEPSMLNGQPVDVQTNIEVSFRLPAY